MAREGRPALAPREQRFTAIDPNPERTALPAGHDVTWCTLIALTPSILSAARPEYNAERLVR